MRCVFKIFLLAAISILPATVEGQFRGARGGGGMHGGARGGGMHGGPGVAPGRPHEVFRGNPNVGVGVARPPFVAVAPRVPIVRSPFIGVRSFHRPIIIGQPFPFYSPFFSSVPFYGSPFFGSSFYSGAYYGPPAYTQPDVAPQPPPTSQNELDLSYQVGRLTQEVEQLRQEQALRQSPPTPAPPEQPAIPTVLVFRDGRRLNVQNYMIVGDTLWVVDEQAATKIPLSDLDLDATRRENRERGVRFLR
jgi:hypothetical protein